MSARPKNRTLQERAWDFTLHIRGDRGEALTSYQRTGVRLDTILVLDGAKNLAFQASVLGTDLLMAGIKPPEAFFEDDLLKVAG